MLDIYIPFEIDISASLDELRAQCRSAYTYVYIYAVGSFALVSQCTEATLPL